MHAWHSLLVHAVCSCPDPPPCSVCLMHPLGIRHINVVKGAVRLPLRMGVAARATAGSAAAAPHQTENHPIFRPGLPGGGCPRRGSLHHQTSTNGFLAVFLPACTATTGDVPSLTSLLSSCCESELAFVCSSRHRLSCLAVPVVWIARVAL